MPDRNTREPPVRPKAGVVIALMALLVGVAAAAHAAKHESLRTIRATATAFVRGQIDGSAARVTVRAIGPDARLRLAACGENLDAFLPPAGQIGSRTTVGIRCRGPKPWKIYVPVLVSRFGKVVVATQSFHRGDTPASGDLKLAVRNLNQLPYGWFDSVAKLAGKHFVRGVHEGEVVTPAMLAISDVIQRGQQVVLVARAGGIQVRMAGKAMADAAPDQRVKVKNLSSDRIVEGVARENGVVEVLP
jgi:flagella basal body P-ring formation protein FlgA